ncbi:hypothetical protein L211DRAFT_840177 [Terfezia boudieri ATCC MYA-4762]|uniref:Uncharacterized protein n=1 Tax=Terfezia boudieri ATCC MYA-4762 TaxID=1051890 RepID=A0A3N4LN12_9PEZI|nr:hypothetical protein L211DRAFT_840177 [Terfezia boudieri ATCC MYA-4762]
MTVIKHNPAPSAVNPDQLLSTLRYQSAPTVLGLPEGSGINDDSGSQTLTSNIVVGHYFNNPLVTGYVREKHPPRKLLEGYEKLVKRQNCRRSKALRRLKEQGIWTVEPVNYDDLKVEASAVTRPPPTATTTSVIDLVPSVGPTNIILPVQPVGEVGKISDRKYRGVIGYNVGRTLQEVQKMFPPRIQELIEEIVEGHTSLRYVNRKYWYIYFKSEAAMQKLLENAPRSWIAREGRKDNDPKITIMKDRHSPSGSDSDSSSEDLGLARRSGGASPGANQLLDQHSISLQVEPDCTTQAKSIVSSANVTSLNQLVSAVGQTSVETASGLSRLSSVVEEEHLHSQYYEIQQALLHNINPVFNNAQDAVLSDKIPPSTAQSTAKPQEKHSSFVSNHSLRTSKPTSRTVEAQPVSSLRSPARLPPTLSISPTTSVSSAPNLSLNASDAEATSIFSDNPFVNETPQTIRWGSRAQDRPGRGELHRIIPTAVSTATKKAQFQATPRPNSVFINAPPGSSSRLGQVMARAWPQPNANITKEPSQSRERTQSASPVTFSMMGRSDTPVTVSTATRVVTPVIRSIVAERVNPESVTPEPNIPKPTTQELVNPITDSTTPPQLTITKTTIEAQTPITVSTIPEVPLIVSTTTASPNLLDLDEESLPISFHWESAFVLPSPVDGPSRSVSTIGDWRTDLAGLEWVEEEVADKGVMDEERNKSRHSGIEAVIRVIECGAGGKFKVDSKAEVIVGGLTVQGNTAITEEVSKEIADRTTPTTTDTEAKKEVNDYQSKTIDTLSDNKIVIKQEPEAEITDLSAIPIYETETTNTPNTTIKIKVSESFASTDMDHDEEWEDEGKAKKVVKKRTAGQRGHKSSSWRKDKKQDLVGSQLEFSRRAAREGALREILGVLRKLEKE